MKNGHKVITRHSVEAQDGNFHILIIQEAKMRTQKNLEKMQPVHYSGPGELLGAAFLLGKPIFYMSKPGKN